MRIYGGDVYGIRDGDECRNTHQREVSTHRRSVLVCLGKMWVRRGCIMVFYPINNNLIVHLFCKCYCGHGAKIKYAV